MNAFLPEFFTSASKLDLVSSTAPALTDATKAPSTRSLAILYEE